MRHFILISLAVYSMLSAGCARNATPTGTRLDTATSKPVIAPATGSEKP